MRTLKEIKDEVAKENGHQSWNAWGYALSEPYGHGFPAVAWEKVYSVYFEEQKQELYEKINTAEAELARLKRIYKDLTDHRREQFLKKFEEIQADVKNREERMFATIAKLTVRNALLEEELNKIKKNEST